MSAPRHVWVDPTEQWVMGQLPAVLLWWDQDDDGSWWGWCSWGEQGAYAHGSKVRVRFERLPAAQIRQAEVARAADEVRQGEARA